MSSPESHQLMDMVDAFVQVEMLQNTRGFDSKLNIITEESGLIYISTNTLIKLRSIVRKYSESKRDG